MGQRTQLALPFALDKTKLNEFLTRWIAIEEEEDRLRGEKRILKKDYESSFPMRGVLTAAKRVRALQKLEDHPTEPMKREHLSVLEGLVEKYLLSRRQALETLEQAIGEQLATGERVNINMTTGEVSP